MTRVDPLLQRKIEAARARRVDAPPEWSQAATTLMRFVMDHHRACMDRDRSAKKLAYLNLPTVPEPFYALDMIPYVPEAYLGFIASINFSPRYLDEAAAMGVSRDACTFCNNGVGALAKGDLPHPDIVCGTMFTLCEVQGKAFEATAELEDVPFELFHLPADPTAEGALEFTVAELKHLVAALEQLSGNTMTRDGLYTALERSNRAYSAFLRFMELRKRARLPISGSQAFFFYYPIYSYLGDQERTIAFYEGLCRDLDDVQAPPAPPDRPPIRLLNAGHYFPIHDRSLLDDLEQHGVTFVSEFFSRLYYEQAQISEDSTLEELYVALARRCLALPTLGTLQSRVQSVGELGTGYEADGAVIFLPWGCRLLSSEVYAKAEHLRKLGIPTLTLDCDPLDATKYSRATVQNRLDAFIEMLRERKLERAT